MNACHSNCQQGRKACPCPAACLLPDDDSPVRDFAGAIVIGAAMAVCLIAVIAAVLA